MSTPLDQRVPDEVELLTVGEAAKKLRVSVATVYRLIKRNELEHVKVSGSITKITPEQLRHFIDAHTVPANGHRA